MIYLWKTVLIVLQSAIRIGACLVHCICDATGARANIDMDMAESSFENTEILLVVIIVV